jgi:hypothetical protein
MLAIALGAALLLLPQGAQAAGVPDNAHHGGHSVTVRVLTGGAYLTVIRNPDGSVVKVYGSGPASVKRMSSDGSSDGIMVSIRGAARKTAVPRRATAYQAMLALGVSPRDAAPFKRWGG